MVTAISGLLHYVAPEVIACKRADKLITVSKSLRETIRQYYHRDAKDIFPVLNGVGRDLFAFYEEKKFEEETLSVLFVGRLHFAKGILALVQNFISRPDLRVKFYILGDGPDLYKLRCLAERDERITILGHLGRTVLGEYLKLTQVFLFPSLHEGFGLSLVEAMASGHACIAYDMPVNREVLGEAGIYVPYNQPIRMLDALEQCVLKRHYIRQKADAAHEKATQYSWDKCGQDMEQALTQIYKEIAFRGQH